MQDELVKAARRMRDRLLVQLRNQRAAMFEMLKWYTATQDPPGLTRDTSSTELYERIRAASRNAWGRLIVDAIAERLEVQGYRSAFGGENDQAARDAADAIAWSILQANRIDSDQMMVHTEALIAGVSYVLVTSDTAGPVLTPETALEVTHEWQPGGRRQVRAALKAFPLDAREWRLELYTPDLLFVWVAQNLDEAHADLWTCDLTDFVDIEGWAGDPVIARNELGVVPVVPFENRSLPSTGPCSELRDLTDIFLRIDELTCDKQVAAHFAAFRQRWATGLEVPRDPITGQPVEPFKAAVSKLWINEDPAGQFGSFEATQLDTYIAAIDAEVAELAAISRVPSHYLMAQNLVNPPSADSLIVGESGLVQKVRTRQRTLGESWEQVVRLALRVAGETAAADDPSSEILWRDPQVRHPAQVADAATKYDAVGVPRDAIWTFLGASPQELERWRAMKAEDDLRAATLALISTPPIPPVPAVTMAAPAPPTAATLPSHPPPTMPA